MGNRRWAVKTVPCSLPIALGRSPPYAALLIPWCQLLIALEQIYTALNRFQQNGPIALLRNRILSLSARASLGKLQIEPWDNLDGWAIGLSSWSVVS